MPDSSFRISASVSIFFSCVASSRSPFCCFSFNSSMAFSCVLWVSDLLQYLWRATRGLPFCSSCGPSSPSGPARSSLHQG